MTWVLNYQNDYEIVKMALENQTEGRYEMSILGLGKGGFTL